VLRMEGCFDKFECYYFDPVDEIDGNENVELD